MNIVMKVVIGNTQPEVRLRVGAFDVGVPSS